MNSTKEVKYVYTKIINIAERNERRAKEMERYTLFTDQKIQCYKDINCTEIYLQIYAMAIKLPAGLFVETDS